MRVFQKKKVWEECIKVIFLKMLKFIQSGYKGVGINKHNIK